MAVMKLLSTASRLRLVAHASASTPRWPASTLLVHPYKTHEFDVTDAAEGINYTADIGAANFLSPAIGFAGTLAAFGPDPVNFLTWPNYEQNTELQVLERDPVTNEPSGVVLEEYIGNLNLPSEVVGGTNSNVSHIEGPAGSNLVSAGVDFVGTNLFSAMGKVLDPARPRSHMSFPMLHCRPAMMMLPEKCVMCHSGGHMPPCREGWSVCGRWTVACCFTLMLRRGWTRHQRLGIMSRCATSLLIMVESPSSASGSDKTQTFLNDESKCSLMTETH